jgi:hypothetical protein
MVLLEERAVVEWVCSLSKPRACEIAGVRTFDKEDGICAGAVYARAVAGR